MLIARNVSRVVSLPRCYMFVHARVIGAPPVAHRGAAMLAAATGGGGGGVSSLHS